MLHKININYIHFLLLSGIFEIESNPHVLQKYDFTYKNSHNFECAFFNLYYIINVREYFDI